MPWDAAYLASQAFARYRMRGGRKPRMLADFLIGAHAAVASHCLVTRDEGYRRHFEVEILNPAC